VFKLILNRPLSEVVKLVERRASEADRLARHSEGEGGGATGVLGNGSRLGHDVQARGPLARPSRRNQDALAPPRVQRQPVLGAAVQDAEVPAGVSGPVRLDPRRPRPRPRLLPLVNTEHHHSGLGLLTPHDVHFGLAAQRVAERAAALTTAYGAHPERFPAGRPIPAAVPTEVWINPPKLRALEEVAPAH
jgi:hypothetical protein